MNLDIIAVHLTFSTVLFFVLNWTGRLARPSGYIALDLFLKRDEAPAFNFVFRAFGPIVFMVAAASVLYLLDLGRYVQDIWLVIAYQFFGRLAFNLVFGRYLLLNFGREALLGTVSIGFGWLLYSQVVSTREYLFPDYETISNHLWLVLSLFLYSTLNQLRFDDERTKRRKNAYLYASYGDNKHRYQEVISQVTRDKLVESIIYSILVYEGFNRPVAVRVVERALFPWASKSIGPMQLNVSEKVSDDESVRIGAVRVLDAYNEACATGRQLAEEKRVQFDPVNRSNHRLYVILRVAAAYNKDDTYATEIEKIQQILAKEFYPDFAPPRHERRSDYLIW